jgi:hypothetical protein
MGKIENQCWAKYLILFLTFGSGYGFQRQIIAKQPSVSRF